jgi:hypothetical protein
VHLLKLQVQTAVARLRQLRVVTFCSTLVLFGSFLQPAKAAFIGEYALDKFTLSNSPFTDGFAATPDGGLSIILTGSDTGSGVEGYTDLTIASAGTGLLSFQFSYFSEDEATFDSAGYRLGSNFIMFADQSGETGTVQIPVTVGQLFGFSVYTKDNTFGRGILTIFDFSAPVGGTTGSVPEPGSWSLLVLSGGIFAAQHIGRRLVRKGRN